VTGSAKRGKEYSEAQEEFEGPQSSRANTTASSQPFESSVEGAEASESAPKRPTRPLPDLRQGIPSTFAEEFLNKKSTTTPEEADSVREQHINLTDDPRQNETEGPGDGAGRDQGELPKSAYQTSIDRRRDQMAKWFYIAFGLLISTGGVYVGRNWDTEEEERAHPEAPSGWSFNLFWERIKARMNSQRSYYTEPTFPKLLPEMDPQPPYTLVLSLEDMLIHSEWTREHGWRTAKRPGVDYFLGYLSQYYELVLFTTMPMAYADQIIKKLDPYHFMTWPLFREATRYENGQYIKASRTSQQLTYLLT
jgi:import inner membrane translocase subunit TIM50